MRYPITIADQQELAAVRFQNHTLPSVTGTLTSPVSLFPLLFMSVGSES
jgi:hypothetical protein